MRPLASAHETLPLRPQDETQCRRCDVHCDKVVYPAACVERECPFVYAYEEFGHTYVGCMQKVYECEIDLHLLLAAERTRAGFGAVRATRRPLPMCRAEVDSCYERRRDRSGASTPSSPSCPWASPPSACSPSFAHSQRACSSRNAVMSDASGPRLAAPVSITAGRPCSSGCTNENAEALAHQPGEHAVVPVAVRPQRRLGVVDVQAAQAVEADALIHLIQRRSSSSRSVMS